MPDTSAFHVSGRGTALPVSRASYYRLQRFIGEYLPGRKGPLWQDVLRASCRARGLTLPILEYESVPAAEGMVVPSRGHTVRTMVLLDGEWLRFAVGGRHGPRVSLEAQVQRGAIVVHRPDGTAVTCGSIRAATVAAARALGYAPPDGMQAWRLEQRPGHWVPLEALRPPLWVEHLARVRGEI
jgi:hypothetical protein